MTAQLMRKEEKTRGIAKPQLIERFEPAAPLSLMLSLAATYDFVSFPLPYNTCFKVSLSGSFMGTIS